MNDEDIKLLKSIVKVHNTFLKGCKKEIITAREIQAIENLLKENEKQRENLKIATAMLTKGTYPSENEDDNNFEKQFIPVVKIKEKIKELDEIIEDSKTGGHRHTLIEASILKNELLELVEGNK